ncbi:hypothetical protein EDD86DRAFT_192811 [Gorgonomyces haynaldii]|nr:hypothetical protein EDD86DRAFT_192811 [Gorgonomyces haynaldii]
MPEEPPETHVEVTEELDPELEKLVHTDPQHGLTDEEAHARLQQFGRNELVEKKTSPFWKFMAYFGGPISILLEIATIISAVTGDIPDLVILIIVLIVNAVIGYAEEAKAENALEALKNTLALKCRAWRNGKLVDVDAAELVPGDIIALRLGDIVPADCRLLGIGVTGEISEGALHIDQSALSGESLPVKKTKGATAYSSSIVKQGQMLCVVIKTGVNTYIGRAAHLISQTNEEGHFQKIIKTIGNFLVILSVGMVTILLIVLCLLPDPFTGQRPLFMEVLKRIVVLTIAAIPIGLPTVMSVTMAVGAKQLAEKKVILKRLPAIEELASVSILCSDKTGTLTLNELTFDKPYTACVGSTPQNLRGVNGERYSEEDILLNAYFASEVGTEDPIEKAVRIAAKKQVTVLKGQQDHVIPGYQIIKYIPFNPNSKYTEAVVENSTTKERFRCIKGAPHVISHLCGGHTEADKAVLELASRGLRALGVARTTDPDMNRFTMIGMISLLDPPRPDSGATIRACQSYGVQVKMITGDQLIIAKEVAHRLGMHRTILDGHRLDKEPDVEKLTDMVLKADGFAQVIPEHKYKVVELLQNRGYLVGMTGDGVNDAPALKKANVGIAVHGCTDAARSAADIVLLAAGLSTIVDGIVSSRKIFQRMRSYSVYRITSTIHFLIFFFVALLAFPDFRMSDRLVIMIAVLNDAATLVIAVDDAKISQKPDKWRLGQLMILSTVLALFLAAFSFITYFIAVGQGLTPGQVATVMYLQISSCPHFVIFSTRVPGWFWENRPSNIFMIAVMGTQVIAMFICVYGVDFLEAHAVGWVWGVSIIATSLACFVFLDIVKVIIIRNWSFELTAKLWPSRQRREKLKNRREEEVVKQRVQGNYDKLRKMVPVVSAANAFAQGATSKDQRQL